MHTGEEWFVLDWQQYLTLTVLLGVYLLLVWKQRLPKMSSFKDFVDVINSTGGHIVLLALFTWWSIKIAMQYFYHTMGLPTDTVTKHDALVSQGIQFVTGTLVGSFLGALLKTMSGGKANGGVSSDGAAPIPNAGTLPVPAPNLPGTGVPAAAAGNRSVKDASPVPGKATGTSFKDAAGVTRTIDAAGNEILPGKTA